MEILQQLSQLSQFVPFGQSDTPKYKNALSISIDPSHSQFDFFSIENMDASTVQRESKPYTAQLYSTDFFAQLSKSCNEYCQAHPIPEECSVVLIVPNSIICMDTISIPNMNHKRNEEALQASIVGLFKNHKELSINSSVTMQNKQSVSYTVTILNDKLKKAFFSALTDGGINPNCITFSSNALIDAVTQLSPKLKGASYLMLDIKHHYSRFAFVAKGKTTGTFELPFGYSILRKSKVFPEEMLFDHSVAELAVLNAKEKAKAKKLTVMAGEEGDGEEKNEEENLDAMFGGDENATQDPTANVTQTYKVLPKKEPRKLPKFMQRPIPKTEEEFAYENFRLFMKWALNLIQSNEKLTNLGKPEAIYVNMPLGLYYILDVANEELEENGIEFRPFDVRGNRDEITDYLELYGGLYALMYNKDNNFYYTKAQNN